MTTASDYCNSDAAAGHSQLQFSDWQSSSSSSNQQQTAKTCDPETGAAATTGHVFVREPAAVKMNNGNAAITSLLAVPAPNPNALLAAPPPPQLPRSFVTLAIPEERIAVDGPPQPPSARSRFPPPPLASCSMRPSPPTADEPANASAVGPVNTLDVRIEAGGKRKT